MDGNIGEIPESLFSKYPKLRAISLALQEYFSGQPVTVTCPTCGQLLKVDYVEIDSTGTTTTWVGCPNGCTSYHSLGKQNENR